MKIFSKKLTKAYLNFFSDTKQRAYLLKRRTHLLNSFCPSREITPKDSILWVSAPDALSFWNQLPILQNLIQKSKRVHCLIPEALRPLFDHINLDVDLYTYEEEWLIGDEPYQALESKLSLNSYEFLFFLPKEENIKLLHLMSASKSIVRIGFESEAFRPYLNWWFQLSSPKGLPSVLNHWFQGAFPDKIFAELTDVAHKTATEKTDFLLLKTPNLTPDVFSKVIQFLKSRNIPIKIIDPTGLTPKSLQLNSLNELQQRLLRSKLLITCESPEFHYCEQLNLTSSCLLHPEDEKVSIEAIKKALEN